MRDFQCDNYIYIDEDVRDIRDRMAKMIFILCI